VNFYKVHNVKLTSNVIVTLIKAKQDFFTNCFSPLNFGGAVNISEIVDLVRVSSAAPLWTWVVCSSGPLGQLQV